jgi:hypothetical protein
MICEDPTRQIWQARQAGQVTVVGDGMWLTVGEATTRLAELTGRSRDVQWVRRLADAGYLFVDRPPAVGEGASHRRIKAESVEAYAAAVKLLEPERSARLEALRTLNRQP